MPEQLLKLCGFTPTEIEEETPRVDRLFKILGFGPEDIDRAEKRIAQNYDVRLEGVRQMLGVWLRELMAVVLARQEGKRIIHSALLAPSEKITAISLGFEDIYCGQPDWIMAVALGGILGKIGPLYEAAEKHALPSGGDHCGLNKIRLGMYLLGVVPKPDLYGVVGIVCDEEPKIENLMSELLDIPVSYIQCCQDQHMDVYPGVSQRQFEYLAESIRRDNRRFEEVIGGEVTEDMMAQAIEWRRKLTTAYFNVVQLMRHDPQPLSQADLNLLNTLVTIGVHERERALQAMQTLAREVGQRVSDGVGVVEKGAPRIMCGTFPSLVDPTFSRMIEQAGLAIPLTEASYSPKARRTLPEAGDSAGTWARRMLVINYSMVYVDRIQRLIEACQTWDIDGILFNNHHSCRVGGTEALMLKKAVKDRLGLPMLVLDWEQFDGRYYSAAQLRTRIESFADMLRMNKAGRGR